MTDLIIPTNGAEPAVQEPKFPSTNFNVTPDGVVISTLLAPGLTITQAVGAPLMNQVCKLWLESQREVLRMQTLAQDVIRTKQRGG